MMLQISQTLLLALLFSSWMCLSQATVCVDETVALRETATLTSLRQEILEKSDSEVQACKTSPCTVDYSKYSATASYKAACTSAGGKNLVVDFVLNCGSGATLLFNNDVSCVSQNCTASEVEAIYDKNIDEVELQLEALGYVCSSDATVKSSGASHCDACFALNILLFSFLLGSLFLY